MKINRYHFYCLSSTNDWCKEHVRSFNQEALTIVTADTQSKGRGQYGRKWLAPEYLNIYASFCFFLPEGQKDSLSLTHLLAIDTIQVMEKYGLSCSIKWPNDILIMGKKIAGILCEPVHLPPKFALIIGIGLNINMPLALCNSIDQPATSLLVETGREASVPDITNQIAHKFHTDLLLFRQKGFDPFLPLFRELIFSNP